jgi:phospholipid/cholesterol/gamma-HCH transport system substrate-binding protein
MALRREIKVGIFVLMGLIVAGAIIFLVGDERRVFDRHFELHAAFTDVAGLKPGAPVRMGGIDVGSVRSVRFSDDVRDKRLHVRFDVVATAHDRIKSDSTVTISNKGLLGDKMMEVTQGTDGMPIIPDGGDIQAVQPEDLAKYLAKANDLLEITKRVLTNIERLTGTAADPQVQEDFKASVTALRRLLGDAAANDGFVHRLLTDPKMADHLDQVFVQTSQSGKSFDRVANEIRVLLRQVKDGPGLAHTLLYSKDGDAILTKLSNVSEELRLTMAEIRTGKGALHELVYGKDGAEVTANMEKLTADLRDIVADIKAGKGTIGALVVDPSIYEDVKSILGNLDRNEVLRALVRYTIKQDETSPSPATAPVTGPVIAPPPVAPAASAKTP